MFVRDSGNFLHMWRGSGSTHAASVCCVRLGSTCGHLADWQKVSVQRRGNVAELLSSVRPVPVTGRSVLKTSRAKTKVSQNLHFMSLEFVFLTVIWESTVVMWQEMQKWHKTSPLMASYWPAGLRRTSRMRTGRAGGRSSAPPLRTRCRPGGNTPAGRAGTAEAKTGLGPGRGVELWLRTPPPEGGCQETEEGCWGHAGGSWCDDWAAAAAAAAAAADDDDDEEDLGGCCCCGARCRGDYCHFGGALARGLALGGRSRCRATSGGTWCGWPGGKVRSLRGSWRAGCLCRTRCWFLSRLLSPADETGRCVNSQDLISLQRLLKLPGMRKEVGKCESTTLYHPWTSLPESHRQMTTTPMILRCFSPSPAEIT